MQRALFKGEIKTKAKGIQEKRAQTKLAKRERAVKIISEIPDAADARKKQIAYRKKELEKEAGLQRFREMEPIRKQMEADAIAKKQKQEIASIAERKMRAARQRAIGLGRVTRVERTPEYYGG